MISQYKKTLIVLAIAMFTVACGNESGSGNRATGTSGGGGSSSNSVDISPGISDDTIKIGGAYPLSGPASSGAVAGKCAEAYFDSTNVDGGVTMGDGVTRSIEFIYKDDQYIPQNKLNILRGLVEKDEVFAIFNNFGTSGALATREYLNQQEVPDVFVFSGADQFGADHDDFPWTIGWQPSYSAEGRAFGMHILEYVEDPKVAVLYQNDDFGASYLRGLEAAFGDEADDIIVAASSYEVTDTSVAPAVSNLEATGANVFVNVTTPKAAVQAIQRVAELDWDLELHLLPPASASIGSVFEPAGIEKTVGIVSSFYLKDPADPNVAEDDDVVRYKEDVAEYAPGGTNADDTLCASGYAAAAAFVDRLEATEAPTRAALMDAVTSMDGVTVPLLLPGISATTGEGDAFPIEAVQLASFNGETWDAVGDVVETEAVS